MNSEYEYHHACHFCEGETIKEVCPMCQVAVYYTKGLQPMFFRFELKHPMVEAVRINSNGVALSIKGKDAFLKFPGNFMETTPQTVTALVNRLLNLKAFS